MSQIYGELIRAQLQQSASDLSPTATGLVYFNTTTGLKWYNGSAWKVAVDLDSTQTLAGKTLDATCLLNSSALPLVPLTKGGLGANASAWSGFVKISAGTASAAALSATDLPIVTAAKGGLGVDASTFTGVLKSSAGVFSAATVVDADVSATAAIARSKVASGTASHVIVNDGTGVLSSEATLAKARGGSGQDNTNVTFPATGTLVTQSATENLSNKTLVEPVIDNFAAFNQEATPAAAAAGTVRVYAKTDNKLYKMDSTGAEAAIGSGSGSGGVNYLVDWYDSSKPIGTVSTVAANGNITVSGSAPLVTSAWYADVTSGASAIAASSSVLLRGSFNYLTALSGASTSGATFVQSAAFNIDGSDLGKPVTISFDVSGVTTADDWDVVVARYTVSGATGTFAELIPVAGNVSSVTGTPGAEIPTGTTQFKGFFIPSATSTDVYSLRFRRRAGATQIRIDSLTVGPQSLAQGAVVTGWQSYTPTYESGVSFGTTSSSSFYWRRVGSSINIIGKITVSGTGINLNGTSGYFTFGIPSGLTISTLLQTGYINFGQSAIYNAASDLVLSRVCQAASSTTRLLISIPSTSSTGTVANLTTALAPSGSVIHLEANIPISEWSSGTTTLADRAVEEYASNTAAVGGVSADDTTSFAYGPQGSQILNITATIARRVRFQTPVLPTDKIFIEISMDRIKWHEVSYRPSDGATADVQPILRQGGVYYGVGGTVWRSATDVDVTFGQYSDTAAALFGGVGRAWSAGAGSWYWRVRKVSSGAAVGFPVSARNVIGDTTSVPSGYVGEVLQANLTATQSIVSTSDADAAGLSLTLGPGVWMLTYSLSASITVTTTSGATNGINTRITDSSNVLLGNSIRCGYIKNMGSGTQSGDTVFSLHASELVTLASQTTYKIRAKILSVTTPGSLYQDTTYGQSKFMAVRIA